MKSSTAHALGLPLPAPATPPGQSSFPGFGTTYAERLHEEELRRYRERRNAHRDVRAPERSYRFGDPVWYQPSLGGRWYAATVDDEPRLLGDTPVVRLRDLEPDYERDHHPGTGRMSVPAASVFALFPRDRDEAFKEPR